MKMQTIKEIKERKSKIEADFLAILRKFEKESQLKIKEVVVSIDKHSWEDIEKARRNSKYKLPKLKGVLDVTIYADIENDPRSID